MTYTQHWAQEYVQQKLHGINIWVRYYELIGDSTRAQRSREELTAIYNSAVKEGVINGWMKGTMAYCEGCYEISYVWDVKMVVSPGSLTWLCSECRRTNQCTLSK